MLNQFIAYLEEQVVNHSIYVWGGQGQAGNTITEAWIRQRETSVANANRAIAFWQKQVRAGYSSKLRAFDCSGLGMYWLQNIKGIYTSDMSANTMMSKCAKLSKSKLKRGDWVFRVNSGGKAYHIGYVVDNDYNVIEAMGRDGGVVKRSFTASGNSYWNAFGRPAIFKAEIEQEVVMNGWVKQSGTWYFYQNNKKRTGWLADGSRWYWLDESTGAMCTGWLQLPWRKGVDWFYFAANGIMATGWQHVPWDGEHNWYYFDPTDGYMHHDKLVQARLRSGGSLMPDGAPGQTMTESESRM